MKIETLVVILAELRANEDVYDSDLRGACDEMGICDESVICDAVTGLLRLNTVQAEVLQELKKAVSNA